MFRSSLKRDIVLVMLAKVAILMIIKTIWFDAPGVPERGPAQIAGYLLDTRDSVPQGVPR